MPASACLGTLPPLEMKGLNLFQQNPNSSQIVQRPVRKSSVNFRPAPRQACRLLQNRYRCLPIPPLWKGQFLPPLESAPKLISKTNRGISSFNGLSALEPMVTEVATSVSSSSGLRAICAGKIWMSSQWGRSFRGTPIEPISPWGPKLFKPWRANLCMRATVGSSGVGAAEGTVADFISGSGVGSPISTARRI